MANDIANRYLEDLSSIGIHAKISDFENLAISVKMPVVEEDVTPPELISFSLESNMVDLVNGPVEITVFAEITDDLSGVFDGTYPDGSGGSPSQARWVSASGQSKTVLFYQNPNGDIYSDELIFDEFSEGGVWTLDSFLLVDEEGNSKYLSDAELQALNADITVDNSGQDILPPVLESLTQSLSVVDFSGGDETISVTVSAKITDDLSGVFDGTYPDGSGGSPSQARWTSASGQSVTAIFADDPNGDGIYEDDLVFSKYAESGTWTLNYFLLVDEAGNSVFLYEQDLLHLNIDASIQITGGTPDIAAPDLVNAYLSSDTVDTTALQSGEIASVDIFAEIIDDVSGVFDGTYSDGSGGSPSQARWVSESGQQSVTGLFYENPNGDVYMDSLEFTNLSEKGAWTIDYMLLADEAGNTEYLYGDDIADLGFDLDFTVI